MRTNRDKCGQFSLLRLFEENGVGVQHQDRSLKPPIDRLTAGVIILLKLGCRVAIEIGKLQNLTSRRIRNQCNTDRQPVTFLSGLFGQHIPFLFNCQSIRLKRSEIHRRRAGPLARPNIRSNRPCSKVIPSGSLFTAAFNLRHQMPVPSKHNSLFAVFFSIHLFYSPFLNWNNWKIWK